MLRLLLTLKWALFGRPDYRCLEVDNPITSNVSGYDIELLLDRLGNK